MNAAVIAACAALVAAVACRANDAMAPQGLVGNYNLIARDGNPVPCCAYTDSQGNLVTLERGDLDLAADGTYSYAILQTLTAGFTLTEEPLALSSGRWTWNGSTLTLVDSSGLGSVSSALTDSSVKFRIQGHQYEFQRLAPVIVGQYFWASFDGGAPTCCAGDSAGTQVSVVGGELEIGANTASGTYQMWLVKKYSNGSGSTTDTNVLYASGAFTWDGQTLTLEGSGLTPADSGSSGRVVGWFTAGGLLSVLTQHHQYQFNRLEEGPQ